MAKKGTHRPYHLCVRCMTHHTRACYCNLCLRTLRRPPQLAKSPGPFSVRERDAKWRCLA